MPDHCTPIAKALRRRLTDTERRLWTQLRAHRLARWKFKRQQPIGPYVVDFVCFRARLVIEVDGGQHQGSEADRVREAWLEKQGYRVLRFWDNEVLTELPAVLEKIAEAISPSPPIPTWAQMNSPHPFVGRKVHWTFLYFLLTSHEGRGELL